MIQQAADKTGKGGAAWVACKEERKATATNN
jgi:hypothetical protein